MEYMKLNNNKQIPVVGYGVYQTRGSMTAKLVSEALKNGYRHIDTAQNYANEHEVGKAIHESNVSREEIFITTKTQTTGYENTLKSIDKSLEKLGSDYFDLILIHWPNTDNIGTYQALEEAYNMGKTRSIGLSNFNSTQYRLILENSTIKPVVNQIETHVYWQQQKMHKILRDHDCVHMAWSPFASGMMNIFEDETLKQVALKHEKSVGQIMLKYLTQNDIVVIPKSTSTQRIKENINIFDFNLDKQDLNKIRLLDQRKSYCDWPTSMREEATY